MNADKIRDRYHKLYNGAAYDALMFDLEYEKPFLLHQNIKPLYNQSSWMGPVHRVLFGPAITCTGDKMLRTKDMTIHMDDKIRIDMFKEFTPGCVQVMESNGEMNCALYGDVTAAIARKFGAEGVVIDAYTRDSYMLEEMDFHIFCRGTHPASALYVWQTNDYQTDIKMSGVHGKVNVSPGDFIFGDEDGVIMIPSDMVLDVLTLAEKRQDGEDQVRAQIVDATVEDLLKMKDDVVVW